MADTVQFLDSFDHAGPPDFPGWAGLKYTNVAGTYTEVPGPYHGVAARFTGTANAAVDPTLIGNWLGPALRNAARAGADGDNPFWRSGAWMGHLRVLDGGWGSGEAEDAGECPVLAPAYRQTLATDNPDFPQHWVTVDAAGTLRVRTWYGGVPGTPPKSRLLAASAPGAFPLGAWAHVEYRVQLANASGPPPAGDPDAPRPGAGSVALRVDGVLALQATGIGTSSPVRAVELGRYWRFGNLGALEDAPMYPNAVVVDVDDVCERSDAAAGLPPPLPWRGPHRVVCLRPTGPGAAAMLDVAGAAANWDACDEVPCDVAASYVAKTVTPPDAEDLPVDLYAATPAPTFAEGEAGAACFVWGMCRSFDGLDAEPGTVNPRAFLRFLDGNGLDLGTPRSVNEEYRYYQATVRELPTVEPTATALTNAQMQGLQVGWGGDYFDLPAPETFEGSQVVAELWYTPEAPPPHPTAGRTWALWWP